MDERVETLALQDAAIGISLNIHLDKPMGGNPPQRTMVFQTHLPQSLLTANEKEPRKFVNKLIDHLLAISDRQIDRARMFDMEFEIAVHEKQLGYASEDFRNVEKRHEDEWSRKNMKGPVRLSPLEETQKQGSVANIERLKQEIGWLKERLKQLKERLARDDYGP